MSKLFIIGNGFDIAHHLPTQYRDFREYLRNNYRISDFMPYPQVTMKPDGDMFSDINTDASILFRLIEEIEETERKIDCDFKWKNFENDLGKIDYTQFLDSYFDIEDDDELFHKAYANEDMASEYSYSFDNFSTLFSKWIETVSYDCEKQKKFECLFDNDSLFLTFNYTMTLEYVYGIDCDKICHIHGRIGEKLIFGHCNEDVALEEELILGNADITYNNIHRRLYKDTSMCISNNINFFNKLHDIEEIYFLGWSFSKVDIEYLKIIKEIIGQRMILIHFTQYDIGEGIGDFADKIKELYYYNFNFKFGNFV